MKKQLVFDCQPAPDPELWLLSRADLEEAEAKIYDSVYGKLDRPTPEQERMTAVFSYAAREMAKTEKELTTEAGKALAQHLRRCMIYARNGLGPWVPREIFYQELLFEYMRNAANWPPVVLFLDPSWEFRGG